MSCAGAHETFAADPRKLFIHFKPPALGDPESRNWVTQRGPNWGSQNTLLSGRILLADLGAGGDACRKGRGVQSLYVIPQSVQPARYPLSSGVKRTTVKLITHPTAQAGGRSGNTRGARFEFRP
jgi:hypothetical protein